MAGAINGNILDVARASVQARYADGFIVERLSSGIVILPNPYSTNQKIRNFVQTFDYFDSLPDTSFHGERRSSEAAFQKIIGDYKLPFPCKLEELNKIKDVPKGTQALDSYFKKPTDFDPQEISRTIDAGLQSRRVQTYGKKDGVTIKKERDKGARLLRPDAYYTVEVQTSVGVRLVNVCGELKWHARDVGRVHDMEALRGQFSSYSMLTETKSPATNGSIPMFHVLATVPSHLEVTLAKDAREIFGRGLYQFTVATHDHIINDLNIRLENLKTKRAKDEEGRNILSKEESHIRRNLKELDALLEKLEKSKPQVLAQ